MLDWNVVVSARERSFTMACDILRDYGRIEKTKYHNIFVMKVASVEELLAGLERRLQFNADLLSYVSRIAPATYAFNFMTPREFEERAREAVPLWAPQLADKSFHVRMHRRGKKGLLHSPAEERVLDEAFLAALNEAGTPGVIRFEDADAVIDLQTLDDRAGMALWTREDLKRYPFLRPD